MLYADIIIDIAAPSLDRTFQYRIPEELTDRVQVGMPVKISFGNGRSLRKGYVVGISEQPKLAQEKIKPIAELCEREETIEDALVHLAYQMKRQYGGTLYEALRTVIPVKQKVEQQKKRIVSCLLTEDALREALQIAEKRGYHAKVRILTAFSQQRQLPYEIVTGKLQVTSATLKSMEKDGMLFVKEAETTGYAGEGLTVSLNEEQQFAANQICAGLLKPEVYLLHGVTGSGKTEVYLKVIEEVIKAGKQAIVLIPEISLTYQMVLRFYRCFGDRVAFLHSKLSKGERYAQCERAKKGEISILIGPRSALFAPFPNLGLIVIDEEHETSYKSENTPKYHAREVACLRAKACGATVLLGSATPSLESYYRALNGEYHLLQLSKRAAAAALPSAEVVDMRAELAAGNRSMFCRSLQQKMAERLQRKEQIILFLNRRGYTGFLSCRSCGAMLKCPHCDISLTLHKDGKLHCHYCGHTEERKKVCPVCGSKYLAGFSTGTQKVEELVQAAFPEAVVMRMDADTTKEKDGYEQILSAFSEGKADILIGTQMIVKGHDFPRVTLVGILAADISLGAPDYRAAERTYQLLAQAAGRAGRASLPGEVVIQTYQPEHYSIQAAAAQDYESFFSREYQYRKLLHYPPAANLMMIQASHKREETAANLMERLAIWIRGGLAGMAQPPILIGPAPAALGKANDIYRKVLYLRHPSYALLIRIKDAAEEWMQNNNTENCGIQFDFNP